MADIDLAAAFDKTPEDAVAYFRAKGYDISDNWQAVWQSAHAKAFTVAKAMRLDILQTLREEVDNALANGITEKAFADNLAPRLQAQGWWGKQIWTSQDGDSREVQLGSLWRLRTIYRTNLQTAYMAGRYRRQLARAKTFPYWQYVAVMDDHTRPGHRLLNGKVFRWDDPIWQYLYPPNGWGCRCRIRALTEAQVKRLGKPIEKGEGYIELFDADAGVDPRTGEIYIAQHMRARLPNGQTMTPDLGWAYNPGQAAIGTDIAIAKKLGTVKDTALRSQAIQTLNNSPLRQQQFADWATTVLTERRAGHSAQALGFMPESISQAVAQRLGQEPARLMVINEKQLMHADSDKHHKDDMALSLAQYQQLPAMLNHPEAVLWEKAGNALLLVYPAEDGRKIKIVIRPAAQLKKQKQLLDAVINAFKVNAIALTNKGLYEVIQGEIQL